MNTPFDEEPKHHHRSGWFSGLRASFLTGLIVIFPISITIWLLWSFIGWVDSFVLPFVPAAYHPDMIIRRLVGFERYNYWIGEDIHINIRGVGVVIFFLFTIFVGWIAKGFIGRSLIRWGESLVDRMPVVRSIYNGVKQIAETVFTQTDRSFETACLIEYPRKGIWAIGFISTPAKGEIAARGGDGKGLISVFVPTTPNPTSGFLLYFPPDEVIELDMSIEDAAKLVISAGLVYPNSRDPSAPPEDAPAPPRARARAPEEVPAD